MAPKIKMSMGPATTAEVLDKDFVKKQNAHGAQSCRGLGKPDLRPLVGNPHATKVFEQMLEKEKMMAGEWACFYHSYNTPALVYEVQAAVAKVLFRFGAQYGVLPRLLKKPFEKISDAGEMLKAFPSWPDQDHNQAFKNVGICVSTSLVSTDPEATPTQVFLGGYGVSVVGVEVVEKLLADCGTPKEHVKKLAQSILDLAKKYGLPQATGSSPGGHLLQIFIHRSCVDKWAYASLPFGVPDHSRHPLSKSMAKSGVIVGQARLTVNPSAFMRSKAVRLYAYSADEHYHNKRSLFQKALFDVLAPILGSPKVREVAAKGVYGGQLPTWWKDLESEANKNYEADASTKAKTPTTRIRCRYGVECLRKSPEHRKECCHPGDLDWSTALDQDVPKCRPRCRFGADCFRKGAEHLDAFAHPDDSDWDQPETTEGAKAHACLTLAPKWLLTLSADQLEDLKSDLKFLASKCELSEVMLVSASGTVQIKLCADDPARLQEGKAELTESGLLDHYMALASKQRDSKPMEAGSAATDSVGKRVDPEDSRSWAWDGFLVHYQEQFSLDELKKFWDAMLPAPDDNEATSAPEVKSAPEAEATTVEKRVDPEDGQSWTWDAFQIHYQKEYGLNDLNKYWQTMSPADAKCKHGGA